MRERSYYRGKKKGKKKEQIGKGTQGATGGASSDLCVHVVGIHAAGIHTVTVTAAATGLSTADSASPSFTGMPVRRSAAPRPPPGPDLYLDPPAATWYRLGSRNPPLQAPHARRHHRRRRKEAKEGGNWGKKQMAGGRMFAHTLWRNELFYVLLLIFFVFLRPFKTFPSLSPIFKGPFFSLDLLRSQQNELYENNKNLYPP